MQTLLLVIMGILESSVVSGCTAQFLPSGNFTDVFLKCELLDFFQYDHVACGNPLNHPFLGLTIITALVQWIKVAKLLSKQQDFYVRSHKEGHHEELSFFPRPVSYHFPHYRS